MYTEIAAGYFHSCAIVSTEITCWGEDLNTLLDHPPGGGFRDLASFTDHTCARTDDATLDCWGRTAAVLVPAGRRSVVGAAVLAAAGAEQRGPGEGDGACVS